MRLAKSVLITSAAKDSVFLRMIPGKSPQYRHFTRQNALFEKTLVLPLSRFLADRFPVIKEMIDLNISKLYISNVQGFRHPKCLIN